MLLEDNPTQRKGAPFLLHKHHSLVAFRGRLRQYFMKPAQVLQQIRNENPGGRVSLRPRCLMSIGCHHSRRKTRSLSELDRIRHQIRRCRTKEQLSYRGNRTRLTATHEAQHFQHIVRLRRTDPLINCGFGRSPCRSSWKESWPMCSRVI